MEQCKNMNILIPESTRLKINENQTKGERSEKMMSVLNSLVKANYSDDQIFHIFYTKPIGEKFREQGDNKDDWLLNQIQKAKEFVSSTNKQFQSPKYSDGELEYLFNQQEVQPAFPDDYFNIDNEVDIGPPPKKISIITGNDFIQKQFDTLPLIDNVLEENSSLLIVGPSGVGKSLLSLYIALMLGNPNPGYLFGKFKINRTLRTVFLQSENSEKIVNQRLKKMIKDPPLSQGLSNIAFPYFNDFFTCSGVAINTHFSYYIGLINDQFNPDVIVIDPLISFAGVDENSNNEMRRVLDHLMTICNQFNIVPIIVHHKGKIDNDSSYASRGASAITDWASSIINLTKKKVDKQPLICVSNTKARSFETFESFNMEINENLSFSCISNDKQKNVVLKILKEKKKFTSQQLFLKEIKQKLNISTKNARELIDDLVKSGHIKVSSGPKNSKIFSFA
jgi:predicted transcriptional regulator